MIIRKKTHGATRFASYHDRLKDFQNAGSLIALFLLMAIFVLGCSTAGSSSTGTYAYYTEKVHDGRVYVIGNPSTAIRFDASPHLPYTQTHIGMGAKGETVIVEVDKKDPSMAKRLWIEYKQRHHYYAEESHNGRVYVLGTQKTHDSFKQTHHLPLTHTIIGFGPNGETVIFEVDKKNPALAARLRHAYSERHRYYAEEVRDGRIYIIGNPKTHASFKQLHHLPYTSTAIGGGPGGETIIFEVDKKNAALAARLKEQFYTRYGLTQN